MKPPRPAEVELGLDAVGSLPLSNPNTWSAYAILLFYFVFVMLLVSGPIGYLLLLIGACWYGTKAENLRNRDLPIDESGEYWVRAWKRNWRA